MTARERLEELDGGYHYDRSVPEGREMSRKNIVVLGPVVVGPTTSSGRSPSLIRQIR